MESSEWVVQELMGDVTVQLLMMVVEPLQCDPRVDDHQSVVDEIWTAHDFQPDSGVLAMPNLVKPISEFVTPDYFVTTIATAEFVLESVEDPFDTAMIEFDNGASATPVHLE